MAIEATPAFFGSLGDPRTLAGIPRMTPELGWIFAVFRPSDKIEATFGQLPSPRAARTVVEGLIRLFSVAFGHTPTVSCS
jgi:hypothetical protein